MLDELGRGGMGVVYRARQVKLKRLVALKVIRDSFLAGPSELRRFRSEAEAVAGLDNPNIVPIYEVGQVDDQPYFSMRLIGGGNLTGQVDRLKADPPAAAALMAKVARAMHYAHQHAILHRDIKPPNILLDEQGEPYVTDFGLAKQIGSDPGQALTATHAAMGTPAYMPPEQASGGTRSVTTAADVYSLGATLYETLTGRPPFEGESPGEIMRMVLDREPARPRSINPKLNHDLETICLKCLEKEPAWRYGSAEALAEDLDRWLAGRPILARPVPTWEKAAKWIRRQPALAALVLMVPLALIGLIGGGVWFTLRLQRERDLANRGRYAADMNLTRRALDDGLIYQVRKQLKTYQSGPGELGDLRGFEWYYLANLCDLAPIRLRGHRKAVICLAFGPEPDGNRLASGGSDGTVRLWDLAGRRATQVFEGRGLPIFCVAISPDGRRLAAGDSGGSLRLWELETGRERSLVGHRNGLRSVTFSPDGRHLLSTDDAGLIAQWDADTVAREFELSHREVGEGPAAVGSGPDVSWTGNGNVAAYGPEGRTIISVGMNEWVKIWDAATRRVLDQVRTGTNIYGFSISPDGRRLALGQQSATITILDLGQLHKPPRVFQGGGRRCTVASSPDGRTLAISSVEGGLRLIDAQKGQILDLLDDKVNMASPMAFGAKGRTLAMAVGEDIRVVHLTRSPEGTTVADGLGPVRRLAVSPDEGLLAVGRDDGTITVWDSSLGRTLRTVPGHDLGVTALAFVKRPGGSWLVSAGGDGLVRVWDPRAGGEPLRTIRGDRGAVYAVAVRPDGRRIVTGGEDGRVHTWDPASGRADLHPLEHGSPVSALAYDPTGEALASGGMDRTVTVWSATSGRRCLGPLSHDHPVTSLDFSPNGRFLAGGGGATDKGGRVLDWDASGGDVSATVESPRGVDSLSFSPDSRRIATCGADSVVQVWDAAGGHETLSLNGHRGRVSAVRFASRGLKLYSAGLDGMVKLWDGTATEPAE